MKSSHLYRSIAPGANTPAWRLLFCSGLLASALMLSPFTSLADGQLDEHEMKAALVFKLTRFVQWPDETSEKNMGQLTICSFGSDPISPYLDELMGETSHKRVIKILHTDHLKEIRSACRVLYVSRDQMPDEIYQLKNSPVLTISDKLGFAKKGGMIQISRRNERLRFHINHASTVSAGIKISAPLLNMSTIIKTDDGSKESQ